MDANTTLADYSEAISELLSENTAPELGLTLSLIGLNSLRYAQIADDHQRRDQIW